MPNTNPQPSAPGGAPQNPPPTGGSLQAMFAAPGGVAQPTDQSTDPTAPQPVAAPSPPQPVAAPQQADPAAQPPTVVADDEADIEPEIDPAEAANSNVLKSYQTALRKANKEAQNLRAAKKGLEAQVETLTATNRALQAQVVPTKRELAFYRTIHEQSGSANGGLNSVLYPSLLWQAIQPHLTWQDDQPTNLPKALADARAAYPALFQQAPPINGGEGSGESGQGSFSMNNFIRGAIRGSGRVQNG